MQMKMNRIALNVILKHDNVRMIEHIDYLNRRVYFVEMYFEDIDNWRTIRSGSFYYCHDLYKLLIRNW